MWARIWRNPVADSHACLLGPLVQCLGGGGCPGQKTSRNYGQPKWGVFFGVNQSFLQFRGISLIIAGMSLTILADSLSSQVLWQSKWVFWCPGALGLHVQSLVLLWETSVWNTIWVLVTLKVKLPKTLEKQYQKMRKTSEFRTSGGSEI